MTHDRSTKVSPNSKKHALEKALPPKRGSKGFTLIEVSIVIGIISLIIGGVVAGAAVIRNAEVRAISKEMSDIESAIALYQQTYGSMPGDTYNAEDLFGCGGCNGNGDGQVDAADVLKVWQHLSLSGLIKGKYDGVSEIPGEGVPESKAGNGSFYKVDYQLPDRTILLLSGPATSTIGALTPAEAYRLDKQLDDGKASTGKIAAKVANGLTDNACFTGNDYNTTNDQKTCNLMSLLAGETFYDYKWVTSEWSSCSASGTWNTGSFGACSAACGDGTQTRTVTCAVASSGSQTRTASCIDKEGNTVDDSNCEGSPPSLDQVCAGTCTGAQPSSVQACNEGACPPPNWVCSRNGTDLPGCDNSAPADWGYPSGWPEAEWVPGTPGACSVSCGDGTRDTPYVCDTYASELLTREVKCIDHNGNEVTNGACNGGPEPNATINTPADITCAGGQPAPQTTACNNGACSSSCSWLMSGWTACSGASCSWNAPGAWSTCDKVFPTSCETGNQTRTVTENKVAGTQTRTVTCSCGTDTNCANGAAGTKPSWVQTCYVDCDLGTKPAESQSCNKAANTINYFVATGGTVNTTYKIAAHTYNAGTGEWHGCAWPNISPTTAGPYTTYP